MNNALKLVELPDRMRSLIEDIKSKLKLSVSDMAKAFGVSRQAIYDWQGGKAISARNAERIADFARAADLLAEANIKPSAHLLRRAITSGKGLIDLASEGVSAETSARKLVEIIHAEAQQRERLRTRLSDRGSVGFSEAGIPMLDEGEHLKVVEFPSHMRSAEEAIEAAISQKPRVVIVVGINEDGQEFDHCSHADLPTLLWLLERAKARLISA